ncbi:MAG: ABC transporter permease [Bacteroidales bacterium]|nr:ABC transporter permease [Bacteroidales bacterium]
MKDLFVEIWESVRRNKLRTCLTGLAVSWGIFMLIVLLGAGNGLLNSFSEQGGTFATNSMMVGGGWTSKPYDGLAQGRRIVLDDKDIEVTRGKNFKGIVDKVASTVGASDTVVLGTKHVRGYIEGNFPARMEMEKIPLTHGRFINDKDITDQRKVVVLPDNMIRILFGEKVDLASVIGKRVKINNLQFQIVGIVRANEMQDNNLFYAPYTTVKTIYAKGKEIDDLTFTFHGLETEEENEAFEKNFKAIINKLHRAAPDDESAIWIWNRFTQNMQMNKASGILTIALWVLGIFTLLGGIVGVSNIMLITVKERTHEFGIRKAIGAAPGDISKLIITESIVITAFFGYIGMVLGMVACEILDATAGHNVTEVMGMQMQLLKNPTVGVDVALEATLLLIIAGTIAGFFPARKATKVRPIEALNAN